MKSQKSTLATQFSRTLIIILMFFLLVGSLTAFYPIALKSETVFLDDQFVRKITESEAAIKPIPGTEKKFLWVSQDHTKTPLSLIYLHGFSASRQEISPVVEDLGKRLQANIFLTRLAGHGLGYDGMSKVKLKTFLQDAEEAIAVGQKMGHKVVVIGMSTGAALSLYLSHKYPEVVAAQILISPNMRPRRWDSLLLQGPLGKVMGRIFLGESYEFKTFSAEEEKYWTKKYPAAALTEMMNLLAGIKGLELEKISTPSMILYTSKDQVVSVPHILTLYEKLGSKNKLIQEVMTDNHVLAGRIKSPASTQEVVNLSEKFIRAL